MIKKEKILKREEKSKRIADAIANLKLGDIISPTKLALSIGIHKNTFCDLMDLFDSLKTIGFETFRDPTGKLKNIHRINENLDTKKEIREMRKDFLDIKTAIDEINIKLSEKKK